MVCVCRGGRDKWWMYVQAHTPRGSKYFQVLPPLTKHPSQKCVLFTLESLQVSPLWTEHCWRNMVHNNLCGTFGGGHGAEQKVTSAVFSTVCDVKCTNWCSLCSVAYMYVFVFVLFWSYFNIVLLIYRMRDTRCFKFFLWFNTSTMSLSNIKFLSAGSWKRPQVIRTAVQCQPLIKLSALSRSWK